MNIPFHISKWHNVVGIATIVFAVLALATLATLFISQPLSAISGKDFKAGDIIDDYTFYNSNSMSATQIQTFLNAKVPSCDTQGRLSASSFGYPNMTRAQYAASVGWHGPPYTCLRNYIQRNTPQVEAASGLCAGISAKTNRSAAYIIKDIAVACGVNPQVLLVLLQKEQSLITDTWPLSGQYESATGFACPDTAPCDSSYGGFFYQVYYAARQYKVYKAYPNDYNHIAGRTNRIYYNPNFSCGSSNVYIANQATAGLYNYTPYQPNTSALNNLYGSGDSCGAYGNRNFWRLFTEWFGSTHSGISVSGISFESQPFTGKQVYAKITIKNVSRISLNLGRIKIEARGSNSSYYQTPSVSNVTVAAGSTYTFKQPITITEEGNVTFNVARNVNNAWLSPPFGDYTITSTTQKTAHVTAEPTIDQSLSLPTGNQHVNAPVTATFRIKNESTTQTISVGRFKLQGSLNGTQYDFPSTIDNVTIAAGQTYTYSEVFNPTRTGTYSFKIINYRSGYGWSTNFPKSSTASIVRTASMTVKDSVTITESLNLSASNAHRGENVTATFKVRNFSAQPINIGRMKVEGKLGTRQYDFPSTQDGLTLQPGQEYTYSQTRTFPRNGTYTFRLMNFRENTGWSASHPSNEAGSVARSASLAVKDPVTVTEGLSLSATNTRAGNTVMATFKMRNFSNTAINIGRMKVQGTLNSEQFDFPSTPDNLTIQPGQEYTYSESRILPKTGSYTFSLANVRDGIGWSSTFPASEANGILRNATVRVLEAVTVTSGLLLSTTSTGTSDIVTASFTLRNFSDQAVNVGRLKVEGTVNTAQYSFPSTADNLTIQPGQEYTYSESRTFPRAGLYSFKIMNYRSWVGWSSTYPKTESTNITRTASLTVR